MTPHINAKENDFSDIVLMPGDPKRAKYIAENFLQNVKLVTDVRGILGYTGEYKGRSISVMASGMGIASIGIYAYELYTKYNVKTIIRIGTAGSNTANLNIFDLVLASSSKTNSTFAYEFAREDAKISYPTKEINAIIENTGKQLNYDVKYEEIFTSEAFYNVHGEENNFKVVEMESFALFYIASKLKKQAACLLTISDSFITKEETTSNQREQSLNKMILLALESALNIK